MADEDKDTGDKQRSEGGVSIQGSDVRIGGDVVGGDKVVKGDQVGGDKITVGDVSGTGIAIGSEAHAEVHQGSVDAAALAEAFKNVYNQIEARKPDSTFEKEEIATPVKKVEEEVAKGEEANPDRVAHWLKTLAGMAPDIFDVTVKTLISPAAGIAEVIRKVAEKAKAESSSASADA